MRKGVRVTSGYMKQTISIRNNMILKMHFFINPKVFSCFLNIFNKQDLIISKCTQQQDRQQNLWSLSNRAEMMNIFN